MRFLATAAAVATAWSLTRRDSADRDPEVHVALEMAAAIEL